MPHDGPLGKHANPHVLPEGSFFLLSSRLSDTPHTPALLMFPPVRFAGITVTFRTIHFLLSNKVVSLHLCQRFQLVVWNADAFTKPFPLPAQSVADPCDGSVFVYDPPQP